MQAHVPHVIEQLTALHGATHHPRIERGVQQVALFWRDDDGDAARFEALCLEHFVADDDRLEATRQRFEAAVEAIQGHRIALVRALRGPLDLDQGELLPIDHLFGAFDPFDHMSEDVFTAGVAFVALLNFRLPTLAQLLEEGAEMSRRDWVDARLAKSFAMRVSGDVSQALTRAYAEAGTYVAAYNIHLNGLLDDAGERPFEGRGKLLSHWGLRDEIKAQYAEGASGLARQRLLQQVMIRILRQEIPAVVIDNPDVDWAPERNAVVGLDDAPREDDVRYAHILEMARAHRALDQVSPAYPTLLARRFEHNRELSAEQVEGLLSAVLSAPVAQRVASMIRGRLGRDLEPFDIWYDGFKSRSTISEEALDRAVKARFSDGDAFQAALPTIFTALGFDAQRARFLADHIRVDPARGAGHAMRAGMRGDSARLRTRIPPEGLDYKGYNIAMHELGHNVEQVLSLHEVDSVVLSGVPNTAFTEAFAFVFQARDLHVLGEEFRPDEAARAAQEAWATVDLFWSTFEISGVALLDIAVWRWIYEHPEATPAALRAFTVARAVELWNQYYAPVLGVRDSPLLAIYSHMVGYALYLPDYPLGHLIQFQIEDHIRDRTLAEEMRRMCALGSISPDAWMRAAVGAPVSAQPLIDGASRALDALT